MSNNIISIFGSEIFLEILKEIKFLSKFQFKNYENLKLCLKENESKDEKVNGHKAGIYIHSAEIEASDLIA